MAAKMLEFDQDARQSLQRGVAKLARAVKVTLGPRGAMSLFKSRSVRRR